FVISLAYEDTHQFSDNPTITLNGPEPSKCTYTAQVVGNSGGTIRVRYTFTIAGERSYPDIESAVLQKIATPADGVMAESTALMYSNCTLVSQQWSHGSGAFEAGRTYALTVNLRAKDGYKFADDFAPVMGIVGYEKAADSVQLSNGNTDAAVTFVFPVGDYTFIDELELETSKVYSTFVPTPESTVYELTFPFKPSDSAPYANQAGYAGFADPAYWYNETDGCSVNSSNGFEVGKVYSIEADFVIKKDLLGDYRFSDSLSATIDGEGFDSANYQVKCRSNDGEKAILVFYFTCQFPQGAGKSESNPAVCRSFSDFKHAMENPDITYVSLGDMDEALPVFEGDAPVSAIAVRGTKYLNLLGNAAFTAPAKGGLYDCLLMTEVGSRLSVQGSGSLAFRAAGTAASNAVIRNVGGEVSVDGGTLIGSYNPATYGMAIWQDFGSLEINDGRLFSENAARILGTPKYPVFLAGGDARIFGGSFSAANVNGGIGAPFGIAISKGASVELRGGSFQGIFLDEGSHVSDFLAEGCVMTCNGSKVNAENYATVSGDVLVTFHREISRIGVSIEAPSAGKAPTENVYFALDGCTVESVVWRESGKPLSGFSFEAGKSYKVEIAFVADKGAKFASPLESATINSRNATVSAYGGDAEKGVVLSVEFGVCPDVVSSVALALDWPKQHTVPDQSAICAGSAYRQALVGENMWDVPVYWEESRDGTTWTRMDVDDTFTVGYCYRASVNLLAEDGYEFAIDPQIEPDVSAEVNGYWAEVFRYPEEDPSELICVRYVFGMLNDSVIEQIDIKGVTEPVVGERPSYICAAAGTGYHLDDDYDDAYDGDVIQNGIGWWDYTADNWVHPDEAFQIGHEYKVVAYVEVDEGYEFYTTGKYDEPAGWGYINDHYATFGKQSLAQYEQALSWVFDC
ncbi:MAG: hypothetical protein IJC51_00335, partial [Eggerthellaceae bacterium]|nr:hypothetical protein [Eggerthellaceae bacterium]